MINLKLEFSVTITVNVSLIYFTCSYEGFFKKSN